MSDEEPKSIREMAEEGTEQAAVQEQFPMGRLDGDGVELATLIQPGHRVRVEVKMRATSKDIPMPNGGMLNPDKEHLILSTCEVEKIITVPAREGDRLTGKTIEGYALRQVLTPLYVERVQGEAGAIEASFVDLLKVKEHEALALLDRLKSRAEKALGVTA
jgi:hypothetical protein